MSGAGFAALVGARDQITRSRSTGNRVGRDPISTALHPDRLTERRRRDTPRVPYTVPAARVWFLAGAAVLVGVSVALRAWHQASAYEVFMDEIEYSDVGNSFAAGVGPELFGDPFYLHPSLPFALLGLAVGQPTGHVTVDFVLGLRPWLLIFGAVNTLLVIGVARRVVGPWAALLSGVVYALDPFVVRFDSRVMLEAPMMTGILAGVLAALIAVDRSSRRARRAWLVAAGVAFGVAICVKTTAALITAVPLCIMIVTGWGLRRGEAVRVLLTQCGLYLVYVLWVTATGHLGDWYSQTLEGTFRAIGLVKQTGFTSSNGPSFVSRIVAQLGLFGPSYLLIGTACAYASYLLLIGFRSLRVERPTPSVHGRRSGGSHALTGDDADLGLLTCWLAGVLAAIVYTFGLGEVEEQTFYLLAVPSTVVVALLVTQMASWRLAGRAVMAVGLAVGLAASGAVWWTVHAQPDDAYRRVVGYTYDHVDPRAQIALGETTAQFVLPGYGVHRLTSVADARQCGCRYGLVSTQLTSLGLAPAKQPLLDELARRYRPVFSAHGRSSGDLLLYDFDQPLDGSAPVVPGARP